MPNSLTAFDIARQNQNMSEQLEPLLSSSDDSLALKKAAMSFIKDVAEATKTHITSLSGCWTTRFVH